MRSQPIGIQLGQPEAPDQASDGEVRAADNGAAQAAARKLRFTDAAVGKIKELEQLPEAAGKSLRIFVQGGGCSGYEYGFTFDERQDDDVVVEQDGIEVLVDEMSLPLLSGSVVDFTQSLMSSGFSVQNPNATASCGCGHSFSA